MKESTTYQAILREGREEGALKMLQKAVLHVLRVRFGVISPEVEQDILMTTDLAGLDKLLCDAVSVAKPEDLLR